MTSLLETYVSGSRATMDLFSSKPGQLNTFEFNSLFSQLLLFLETQSSAVTQMDLLCRETLQEINLEQLLPLFQNTRESFSSIAWEITNEPAIKNEKRNEEAINLLKLWREGDQPEQIETLNYLKEAIDRDRLSNRKLFS